VTSTRGWCAAASILAGVALLGYAVATAQAHLYLLLIVPVVTGSSGAFFAGVLLVFLGIAIGATIAEPFEAVAGTPPSSPSGVEGGRSPPSRSGGLILIGPVPIALGTARPQTRRGRYLLVAVAVGLFVAVLLVFWL